MIRNIAMTNDMNIVRDLPLDSLSGSDIKWFWVDFDAPTENEALVLESYFHFHPLAIEDCLHFLQRPKLDYYGGYNFFVILALNQKTLTPEEVDLFVGKNYVISFHLSHIREIEDAWQRVLSGENDSANGPGYVAYLIVDKIVDQYFPAVYQIEDQLNVLNGRPKNQSVRRLVDEMFDIRADLLKLRGVIGSMRDLLYRILNSERLEEFKDHRVYFADINDHLLKLSEMIESSRDITADMRDSYLSLNSHRMNTIMMTLTIVTSIFIPLTFIVGVYGMNFDYMPELHWHYGYFAVLGVMTMIGVGMFLWFKQKGWFDVYK